MSIIAISGSNASGGLDVVCTSFSSMVVGAGIGYTSNWTSSPSVWDNDSFYTEVKSNDSGKYILFGTRVYMTPAEEIVIPANGYLRQIFCVALNKEIINRPIITNLFGDFLRTSQVQMIENVDISIQSASCNLYSDSLVTTAIAHIYNHNNESVKLSGCYALIR